MRSSPNRLLFFAIGALGFLTLLVATRDALSWHGHPTAPFLVDPGGVVSNFGGGGWLVGRRATRPELVFPDVILEVDGVPLVGGPGSLRARAWDAAIDRAGPSGSIEVAARTRRGVVNTRLEVSPLTEGGWWTYAASLLFSGTLFFVAGLIALWVSPASALAKTLAKVSVVSGLFVMLTFDAHTTRHFGPLFWTAFAMTPGSWIVLILRLPDDAPILRRIPWFELAVDAVGACVAAAFLILHFSGRGTRALQVVWSPVLALAFTFVVVTVVVRFVRARGVRRARLRALLLASAVPFGTNLIMFYPVETSSTTALVLDPLVFGGLSLFPLAIGYAVVRYDLWGSRALLSRLLTRLAVGGIVGAIAVALGSAIAVGLGIPFNAALVAAGFGAAIGVAFVLSALSALDRGVFVARVQYKPTVEQLGEELISITAPVDVARAVERTVRRWLDCEIVDLSLVSVEPASSGVDSPRDLPVADVIPDGESLLLPVEFGGVRLGNLRVGPKSGGALFTEDDLDLLKTIANQGALALAHARAYEELENRRREQAAAWREERSALVETVAAELAHEIRYPINFFRNLFGGRTRGNRFEAEDIEIGLEEVERLERLVSGLRRMATRRLERAKTSLGVLCDRTETLLRDTLGTRRIRRGIPDGVHVFCDPDQMTQILVNLVANALQAAGANGDVGIEWAETGDPAQAELTVWDTGSGFEGDGSKLFAPWYTTKPGGSGLGLAITHRLVRAHGWNINAVRKDGRTKFVIGIRVTDLAGARAGESRAQEVA